MIKLYRGAIHKELEEICLFQLESNPPERLLDQLLKRTALPKSSLNPLFLENKYFFTIESNRMSSFPVLELLDHLEVSFPQMIWSKVIRSGETYKVEFIPVSFLTQRHTEDGCLADCLEEMGYHAENLIPTFKKEFEKVFRGWEVGSFSKVNLSEKVFYLSDNAPIQGGQDVEDQKEVMSEEEILIQLRSIQGKLQQNSIKDGEKSLFSKKKRKKENGQNAKLTKKAKYIYFGTGVLSLTFTILISCQFYTVRIVEGDSMAPTLKNKEILVVDKKISQISRNDMISFDVPELANKEFVKRVVGLPGDQIYASGGNVYVNNKKIDTDYTSHTTQDFDLKELSGRETVPEGKIFVLGDNRAHSTDSRNFGFVDEEQVEGKVIFK